MQAVPVIKEICEVKSAIVGGRGAQAIKSDIILELENLCRNRRKMSDELFARVNGTLYTDRNLVHFREWVGEYISHGVLKTSFDPGGSETTSIVTDALDTDQIRTRASSSQENELQRAKKQLWAHREYVDEPIVWKNKEYLRKFSIGKEWLQNVAMLIVAEDWAKINCFSVREQGQHRWKASHCLVELIRLEELAKQQGLGRCSKVYGDVEAYVLNLPSSALDDMSNLDYIFKNYIGDHLSFGVAAEPTKYGDYKIETAIVGDDCALPPPRVIDGRRDLAGTILVHKVTGVAASLSLTDISFEAQRASETGGTTCVALFVCMLPGRVIYYHLDPRKMELAVVRVHTVSFMNSLDMAKFSTSIIKAPHCPIGSADNLPPTKVHVPLPPSCPTKSEESLS
ncbi:hypothetical protein V6N11_027350 [Hibiscus sabdariffa]|uniref:DhaK domain-containing protein n=1 Tax=Hibiscus sabdariffa TaxID=183260 RepID=A0ABR2PH14_9ROSI